MESFQSTLLENCWILKLLITWFFTSQLLLIITASLKNIFFSKLFHGFLRSKDGSRKIQLLNIKFSYLCFFLFFSSVKWILMFLSADFLSNLLFLYSCLSLLSFLSTFPFCSVLLCLALLTGCFSSKPS